MDRNNEGEPVNKKRKITVFQCSWLDEDIFKGWLTPHPEMTDKALCIACNKTMRCMKIDLVKHSQTVRHNKNVNSFDFKATDNVSNNLSHKDEVKSAEIILSAFFAEHNVAFCAADHLIPVFKRIGARDPVVQDLSLARNKCANVVKNILAKREIEKIVQCLQTCRFSILIDESTDITDVKVMCILVQYVSPLNKKLTTQLLTLLPLDATDCSASKIFELFKNFSKKKKFRLRILLEWHATMHRL